MHVMMKATGIVLGIFLCCTGLQLFSSPHSYLYYKLPSVCRGHKKAVWCFALYKQRLYSSGGDNLIKVWDLDVITNGCIKTMEGHTGVVRIVERERERLL